ncbi:hypothetical protein GQ53DRAFT_361332 [Thozetella sp. PMI_491]|nr:hypothetical protein GQ53DRAFT_361332 [Thozetella sp. PMI_491]
MLSTQVFPQNITTLVISCIICCLVCSFSFYLVMSMAAGRKWRRPIPSCFGFLRESNEILSQLIACRVNGGRSQNEGGANGDNNA